jgi:hypothetical protein
MKDRTFLTLYSCPHCPLDALVENHDKCLRPSLMKLLYTVAGVIFKSVSKKFNF